MIRDFVSEEDEQVLLQCVDWDSEDSQISEGTHFSANLTWLKIDFPYYLLLDFAALMVFCHSSYSAVSCNPTHSSSPKGFSCLLLPSILLIFLLFDVFLCVRDTVHRTCFGRLLVWATTRLGRPQSPAWIVSNNKVPGVSDHLPDATSDRVIWFNQR